MENASSRYQLVSRRALLKASAGLGVALVLPGCGNNDAEVFAGASTDPVTQSNAVAESNSADPTAVATTPPITQEPLTATPVEPTPVPESAAVAEPTATSEAVATPEPTATPLPLTAVAGEMVISFTYTQGATGKNERPYIAVWLENEAGELLETVALWYQQARRGERWLDHLDRWWDRDQARIVAGGADDSAVISSATRQAGSYAVAWDGAIDGVQATAGRYFLCVEAAREEGPYSLVREALDLAGSLPETALPDNGELSGVTVRVGV